jgi:glycosyltransferase involved in cell wall biosynthesis
MKIAHVVARKPHPDIADGVRKYIYFIARAQTEIGQEVGVFWLDGDRASAKTTVPCTVARGFKRPRFPFQVPDGLTEQLGRWQPDVLHLHSPYFPPNVTLARWARRARIPYVVTPHGALSPGELRQRWPLKLPYKFLFERPTLNRAAFVHAVGAEEHLRGYGTNAPVELAPGGVDVATMPRGANRAALVDRYPILDGRRIFLFLGRLDPDQKGLDLLLQAFAEADLEGAALVLVGPDFRGGRKRLERLTARLRSRSPIMILDAAYGRETSDLVAAADVFVNTARWEGMPLAVLEAAAARLPCLLTTVADPMHRLSGDGAALSVAADVAAIADGLRRMHQISAGELCRMGERGRDIVAAEFTWRQSARLLADAYRRHAMRGKAEALRVS